VPGFMMLRAVMQKWFVLSTTPTPSGFSTVSGESFGLTDC
jgi:hypothetical protein